MNDIVIYVENPVTDKLFADDIKLYTIISDEFSAVKLQTCLDCLYN